MLGPALSRLTTFRVQKLFDQMQQIGVIYGLFLLLHYIFKFPAKSYLVTFSYSIPEMFPERPK
jgi:hypothetical protein